jgi:hypothetical protein
MDPERMSRNSRRFAMSPHASSDTSATRFPGSRGIAVAILIVTAALPSPASADRAVEPTETPPVVTVRGPSGSPWSFVYDVGSQRLGGYESTSRGLERRGIRRITWDLLLDSLPPWLADRKLSVTEVRKLLEERKGPETDEPASEKGPVALSAVRVRQSEPWVFLYDVASERLAGYRAGREGLELRSVRQVTWDLRLEELIPHGHPLPPAEVRRHLESLTVEASEAGPVRLATTTNNAGDPCVFLYDPEGERLAAYTVRNRGLQLKGVRRITWDRKLPPGRITGTRPWPVAWVREQVEGKAPPRGGSSATPGPLTLSASQNPSEDPILTIHDRNSGRLIEYRTRNRGIELAAIRNIAGDLEEVDEAGAKAE